MSEHRAQIKIEFSIYGEHFDWDTSINYIPDQYSGIDDRVVQFFAVSYDKARAKWEQQNELYRKANEEKLKAKLEKLAEDQERAELVRLKLKYEHDAYASGDVNDFERTDGHWTATYTGDGAGIYGRMPPNDTPDVRWNPTPEGEVPSANMTCRVCGHGVTLKVGDLVQTGDSRLCEHMGPIVWPRRSGFGMKAEGSPASLAECMCGGYGTIQHDCPLHGDGL